MSTSKVGGTCQKACKYPSSIAIIRHRSVTSQHGARHCSAHTQKKSASVCYYVSPANRALFSNFLFLVDIELFFKCIYCHLMLINLFTKLIVSKFLETRKSNENVESFGDTRKLPSINYIYFAS